ncbi:DUF190 domain-containing protein [Streptomyces sp. B1I3]|uniref:DUF190 domain-containing protein n=1 Tax=Streptomyces sp. B1I3 TaxID=3042264 RepID=UPI002786189D|nr:DUF190 domain-containing protein [Streptomyces sp. B1I3]MDQ0792654.1 PII-like signaling protein [Streptomyces sp. B1I3]
MSWTTVPALRLTALVADTDRWHHRPLYSEIVHRAHAAGLSGASVLRGVEGFGSSRTVHTTRLVSLADDLPVMVVVVDTEERIHAFVPELEDLGIKGPVTLEPVRAVRFTGSGGTAP